MSVQIKWNDPSIEKLPPQNTVISEMWIKKGKWYIDLDPSGES